MNTFKKLFATVAAVMVVASTVPANVFAASYDAETQAAYDYAFGAGLTTQSTIDGARMFDNTTRAEFAKIASVYATEVLGMTADTSASCSFTDLSAIAGSDLVGYVTTACQLGLMGVGTNGIFNPTGILSRAEAFTVIDRMLNGNTNDGGTPFYAAHLNALHAAGLVNDISNPMRAITRGNAFIVLQRTEDTGSTPAVCQDPMVQLSCALGLSDCPAECSGDNTDNGGDNGGDDNVVHAGDLDLTIASGTPTNGSSIPLVGTVPFASIKFAAGSDDIKVSSVTVERFGLGQRADITKVYFEKDGLRVSGRASLSSDNTATISFSPAFEIKRNSSETLELIATLSGLNSGGEHGFKIVDVNSSANSQSFNISTPTLRTSSYTVGSLSIVNLGSPQTVRAGEADVELGQFRLTNGSTDNKSVNVKSISLRQNGTADIKNLIDLAIYRDGQKVSTSTVVNGKDVAFALDTTLTDSQSATFYVRGTVDYVDQASETYKFTLRNTEDLVAAEATTHFRTTLSTPVPYDLSIYTAEGADVQLSRDVSMSTNLQVAPGATDVALLKGKIKSSEAINLEDLTLAINSSANLSTLVTKFTLKIGSSTSTWTPANVVGNQTAAFDGTFSVDGSSNVSLTADIKSNATGGTFSVTTIDLTDFAVREYSSSQNQISPSSVAGSIAGPIVTVTASRLNVARTDGLSSRNVVAGSNDVVLGKARFTTSDAGSIKISSLQLQGIAVGSYNQLSVSMYINGSTEAASTRTANGSTITFGSLPNNATVSANSPLTVEFRGSFTQNAAGVNSFVVGAVQATDNNGQTVAANPTSLSFATVTLNAGGNVAFSANAGTPGASLLNGGLQAADIAKFNINATDDDLRLTDLYVTRAAGSTVDLGQRLSDIQLLDGNAVIANGTVVAGGETIAFENLNANNVVTTAGNSKTLTIKATVNNVLNSTDVSGTDGIVKLAIGTGSFTSVTAGTVNGARFISEANGSVVTPASVGLIISNAHRIVRGKAFVAAAPTTASQTRVLNFTVLANGNRVKVQNVNFTLRNIDGSATVNLYKDSVSLGNLLTGVVVTGATGANTQTATLALGALAQEIAAGATANYVVEIVGYTPSESNGGNFLSRQFELNDVSYQDVFNDTDVLVSGLSNYINAGNFAINAPSFNPSGN